ncbi:MAG: hypothetical protein QNL11_13215 [Desulfobacterales bacterium]|nr:hypothetical protein [Deltaproteobacteria bacterium]MBW2227087.1 hypothetical protein [Deltaproteobacteria bacterium]MDX2498845.1 hypothetical protein [Desulfobacterales bacterium]
MFQDIIRFGEPSTRWGVESTEPVKYVQNIKASLNAVVRLGAHHFLLFYADDRRIRCTYTREAII